MVSSTLDRVEWNAELVRGDLAEAVLQLKRESGKGLFVGSHPSRSRGPMYLRICVASVLSAAIAGYDDVCLEAPLRRVSHLT